MGRNATQPISNVINRLDWALVHEEEPLIIINDHAMLDTLSFQLNLSKLQHKKGKSRKFYKKKIDKARKENKSSNEIESLIHEDMHIRDLIDDDIAQLQNRILIRQAEKFLIATPTYNTKDGNWEQSDITGRYRLSQATMSNLKDDIRQERKDRRERWQGWLTALTGIIGALIGLLSVLQSD